MRDYIDAHAPAILRWVAAAAIAHAPTIPAAVNTLFWFMVADIATGIFASWKQGKPVMSATFTRGFATKGAILLFALMGHPIEAFASEGLGITVELNLERWLAVGFTFGEIFSIVENSWKAGVPIPDVMVDFLIRGKKLVQPADTQKLKNLFGDKEAVGIPVSIPPADTAPSAKQEPTPGK